MYHVATIHTKSLPLGLIPDSDGPVVLPAHLGAQEGHQLADCDVIGRPVFLHALDADVGQLAAA